ncbi:hypothetical protein [Embleya sp. NPDC005971]|uniref:hypothetical protein n=1 Tax=Embleya sp. NPDC005971 TaxID=3156724 RepID=UPI00340B3520
MKPEKSLLRSTTRVGTPDPFGAAISLRREARRRGCPPPNSRAPSPRTPSAAASAAQEGPS